jgi:multidrug efflux system membrane fusion protein
VQRGPQGTFVYVVEDSKVAVRPITVAQQDDTRAVISDGLKAQEQVVTTGFTRLSNGTRVNVQASDAPPAETAPAVRPQGPEAAAPEAARPEGGRPEGRPKRDGGENTSGKERRRRTENAPGAPSTKQ